MITLETIRACAMGLPDVDERTHFGRPGFRVRDALFASFHGDADRPTAIVNIDPTHADAASADPALEPVWRTHGKRDIFVGLRVDLAQVSQQRFRELLELAWRNKAPKRLVAAYDAERQTRQFQDRAVLLDLTLSQAPPQPRSRYLA